MPAYKNEKRGSWYVSLWYHDARGVLKKKKKEGFPTKREAKEWERIFFESHSQVADISFPALVESFLKSAKARWKPSTWYVKNRILQTHILPHFQNMTVDRITIRTVEEWEAALVASGLKASYVRTVRALLSSVFNHAIRYYGLSSNPSALAQCVTRQERKVIAFWTLREFQQFAMTLRLPHHIIAFYLLFWTGMRVGELLALTWEDIDMEKHLITISKTMYRVNGEDSITTPKTANSSRVITLPRFLIPMMEDYKRIATYITEGRIIPCTRSALLRELHEKAKKAGVRDIRIHNLRHSHASLLINMGCPPTEVADRLGHANASITLKVYSHMYESNRRNIADKLDNLQ